MSAFDEEPDGDVLDAVTREVRRRIASKDMPPVPKAHGGCSCACHKLLGVTHVTPCCTSS